MVGRMLSRIGLCSLLAAGCSESSGPLAPCTAAAPLVNLTAGEYRSADPRPSGDFVLRAVRGAGCVAFAANQSGADIERSEEHTSELQSLAYLVCRLLLEKKKKKQQYNRRA